jgi:hypothetical protein
VNFYADGITFRHDTVGIPGSFFSFDATAQHFSGASLSVLENDSDLRTLS